MSCYALIGDRDVPLLYDQGEGYYGIGKSAVPFPATIGVHDACFDIEEDHRIFSVSRVEVVYVTRRHCWFVVQDDEEDGEVDEETEEECPSEDETVGEESLWESELYPDGA